MIDHIINPLHLPGNPIMAHILTAVLVLLAEILLYTIGVAILVHHIRPASPRNCVLGRFLSVILGIIASPAPTFTFRHFYVLGPEATSVVLAVFAIVLVSIGLRFYRQPTGDHHAPSI